MWRPGSGCASPTSLWWSANRGAHFTRSRPVAATLRSTAGARAVGERSAGTRRAALPGPGVRCRGRPARAEPGSRFGRGTARLAAGEGTHVSRGDRAVPESARLRHGRFPPAGPTHPALSAGRADLPAPGHESVSRSPPGHQGDRRRGTARDRAAHAERQPARPGARELARGRRSHPRARRRNPATRAVQGPGGRQPPREVGRAHRGGESCRRRPLHPAGDAAHPHCRWAASAQSRARRQEGDAGYTGLASGTELFARADVHRSGLPLARHRAARRSRRRRAPPDRDTPHGCVGRSLRRGRARKPRVLEANARANASQRDAWKKKLDAVRTENAARLRTTRLVVRAGPETIADRGSP